MTDLIAAARLALNELVREVVEDELDQVRARLGVPKVAHQGEKRALGSTGGERAPTLAASLGEAADGARRGTRKAADARPVAEQKGGPPAPARAANRIDTIKVRASAVFE